MQRRGSSLALSILIIFFFAIGRNLRELKISGQLFSFMTLKFKRSQKNIREVVSSLGSKKQVEMSKMFQEIKC